MRQRRYAALLAIAACALGSGGCSVYNKGLGQQEVVVVFQDGATRVDHARVRDACKGVPGVVAEPLATSSRKAAILNEVRFDVSKASDQQRAALYTCLQKDPSYKGASEPEQQ